MVHLNASPPTTTPSPRPSGERVRVRGAMPRHPECGGIVPLTRRYRVGLSPEGRGETERLEFWTKCVSPNSWASRPLPSPPREGEGADRGFLLEAPISSIQKTKTPGSTPGVFNIQSEKLKPLRALRPSCARSRCRADGRPCPSPRLPRSPLLPRLRAMAGRTWCRAGSLP